MKRLHRGRWPALTGHIPGHLPQGGRLGCPIWGILRMDMCFNLAETGLTPGWTRAGRCERDARYPMVAERVVEGRRSLGGPTCVCAVCLDYRRGSEVRHDSATISFPAGSSGKGWRQPTPLAPRRDDRRGGPRVHHLDGRRFDAARPTGGHGDSADRRSAGRRRGTPRARTGRTDNASRHGDPGSARRQLATATPNLQRWMYPPNRHDRVHGARLRALPVWRSHVGQGRLVGDRKCADN